MKHIIVVGVTNLADRLARNSVEVELRLGGDFPADDHQVAFCISLTGHATGWVLGQAGIQHRVGNRVANLVRMALADGFRRKDVIFAHEWLLLLYSLTLILTYQDR